MYSVRELVRQGLESPQVSYSLNPSQGKAVDIIYKAYEHNGVGLVQGPPGTGKTSVIVTSLERLLNELDKNEVLVYVAPTNELVKDVTLKVVPILREVLGYKNEEDIYKAIRIFGSDFDYRGASMARDPINKDVKVILTTDYQKFYISYKEAESEGFSFSFLVDEASKSPIYRFLTPIAMELIRAEKMKTKRNISIDSLSVVGDPMQAIAKKDIYKTHREYLLMVNILRNMLLDIDPSLADQLKDSSINLYDIIQQNSPILSHLENFVMLDVTYRLPSPSHTIISKGFYSDRLSANEGVDKRLVYRDDLVKSIGSDFINSFEVARVINDAVANEIGVVYIDVKKSAYRDFQGENIDRRRAYRAIEAAIAASIVTGKSTTIIPIYRDMTNYIKFVMKADDKYAKYVKALSARNIEINVMTAHSLLGAEDNNVVLVLGKEYLPKGSDIYTSTMYFAEPEIFNVQFSRHKALLIIVGYLEKLYKTSYEISSDSKRCTLNSILKFNSNLLKNASEAALELCGFKIKDKSVIRGKNTDQCEIVEDEG